MKYLAGLWLVAVAACSSPAEHATDAAVAGDAAPSEPDAAQSSVTTDYDVAVVGRDQILVTVTLRDADGMPLPGVTVDLTATGSANTFSPVPPTDGSGTTTSVWTTTMAGTKAVTAVARGVTIGTKTVRFVPAPANHLVFIEQPTTTVAGASIAPVMLVAEDAYGNVDARVTQATVTAQLDSSAATLAGTTSVTMVDGLATFVGLRVDTPGSGYQLRAQVIGLTDGLSTAFDVVAGDPDSARSSITAAPASLEANGIDTTTLTAHLVNAYGIAVTGAPVAFSVTGTNNMVMTTSSVTDSTGTALALLASTTAEVKTVTVTSGPASAGTSVHFFPASCVPRLPGPPGVVLSTAGAALLVTDIDGDGHLDAIVGEPSARVSVYRGRGDGTFFPPIDLGITERVTSIAAGDLDNDGTLDLVMTWDSANSLGIALGTGGGTFGAPTTVPLPSYATHVALGDFDRDGNLDVAAALLQSEVVVERGAGDGTFSAGQTLANIVAYDIAAADFDRSGTVDLLVAESGGPTMLAGQGDGTFGSPMTSPGAASGTLVIGNFNGDATLDCAVANRGGTLQPYLGNGDGTFSAVGSPIPTANDNGQQYLDPADPAGLVDLDGDGRLDLVLAEGASLSILKGGGDGSFSLGAVYASNALYGRVADMDGDGTADIVALGGELLAVVHGQPGGSFVAPASHREPVEGDLLASGDFDNDGHLDLVYRSTAGIGALLSQPDGTLVDAAPLTSTPLVLEAEAGDVTGDGALDLVSLYNGLQVAAGRGDGTFDAFVAQSLSPYTASAMQLGDFDRDGKQDLVFADSYPPGFWLARSLGDGTVGALQYYAGGSWAMTGDVNGDGTPDVITPDGATQNLVVYLGDGQGGVVRTAAVYPSPVSLAPSLPRLLRDLDGDGRADLVMLHPSLAGYSIDVMRGLASGDLAPPITTPMSGLLANLYIMGIELADITGDGALDLVIRSPSIGVTIVPGYGDGYFQEHAFHYSTAYGGGSAPGFALGDLDRDGRPDIAFGKGFGVGIALNRSCVP